MEPLDLRDPDALDRPIVRAAYCRHLLELLVEEGIPAAAVLAESGLRAVELSDPELRISYAQQLRIYRNALSLSGKPGLGLRLGARQRIRDHGVFGYALQSSADLAQALRIVIRYQITLGPLLEIFLETEEDAAIISFAELTPLGPIARTAREEALVAVARGLLPLTDPPTVPLSIHLDLPSRSPSLYSRYFDCPVHFGSTRPEIRIRRTDLDRPLVFSDEETARVCERRCAELLERLGSPGGLVESVRRVLVGTPGHFPSLDETARELAMSGRTLRRHLRQADTSFQDVVAEVRQSLALDYLQRSNLSVDEIASLLGYSETQNFYRAFRRWMGRPPSAYRR